MYGVAEKSVPFAKNKNEKCPGWAHVNGRYENSFSQWFGNRARGIGLARTIGNSVSGRYKMITPRNFSVGVFIFRDAFSLTTSERFVKIDSLFRSSAAVAQLAVNQLVVGSNPTSGARFIF